MKIGIIGGTGLYGMSELKSVTRKILKTPFGAPSDAFVCGKLEGREVVFLPRHGEGHRILPSEINYRANIIGLKMLGVGKVISVSAVGSLKEEYRPGDIVLPDQYFDRTKASDRHTFFGKGVVAHVSFADPVCADLRKAIARTARNHVAKELAGKNARVIEGGIYVNMEGPAFSTRAESNFHRSMGFDVIGMTSLAEAKLCREAEMCYQAMAFVTDYDCWRVSEEAVSVEMLIGVLKTNAAIAQGIVRRLAADLPEGCSCSCRTSLKTAIMTDRARMPAATRKKLAPIIGKYV